MAAGPNVDSSENYYRATANPHAAFPPARGNLECSVCIIGGGLAGLNTALGLAERGHRDVVMLESERIAFGASGRNGGFVFGGFSRGEDALLRDLGPHRARELHRGTLDAVETIRQRIASYAIDCDVNPAGVLWANWFRDPEVLRARQRLLAEHFGTQWEWVERARMRTLLHSERYTDGLFERSALHMHPLNYAVGIAQAAAALGITVFEQSPATALERDGAGWLVRTNQAQIRAEQVVLACGGYLAGLRREVDAGVLPIATYVMVTEPLQSRLSDVMSTQAAVYDSRFAFDYYRPLADTRLLWGGRISVLDRKPDAVKRLLYRDLLKVYPQLDGVRIDYAWSGLMSYARHQMPQIGRIDDGLWLAQAFGGHGVAPTTFAGDVIASAIAEDDQRWKQFAAYPLVSALKPAGFIGAQLNYWWAQARDAWNARRG